VVSGGPAARDEGLIAEAGLSNISLDQLRHAVAGTDIVCVQNLFHLAFRCGTPVLEECLRRGIAFVPFCPLGWPRGPDNPVLTSPVIIQTAARLGITPAQVALRWLLQLAPNVLLIPRTGSVAHLRENLAAEGGRPGHPARRAGAETVTGRTPARGASGRAAITGPACGRGSWPAR
jgi:pyridoxine 4-dehydrogenase